MKKLPVFFFLSFLFLSAFQAQAQKKIGGYLTTGKFYQSVVRPAPQPDSDLEGRWIRTYDGTAPDRLVFTRFKKDQLRWGNYLEFLPDRAIAKGYSAPCGNDTNIHRHNGSYKLELQTIFIDLGPNGTLSYRILEHKGDRLVLQPLN
jgi:hypothetical protein